jgi:lysophospholipase L1-like esterase
VGIKIVGLGDSTTAGTPGFLSPLEAPPDGRGNVRSQYAYWVMEAHPDWTVLNRGINGQRSDQILERFERDVAREAPRFAVILAGVNDIYQGLPLDFITRNLAKMYDMALGCGAVPIGCTVLPYNTMSRGQAEERNQLNRWVEAESRRRGILFCDTAKAVANPTNPDRLAGSPDGLHPDPEGYRKMAQAVSQTIEESMRNST